MTYIYIEIKQLKTIIMKKEGTKSFLLQLDEEVYNEYRELCKQNGLNMSQRLRNLIKMEIEKLKEGK